MGREKRVSDDFHVFFEQNRLWEHCSWLGVPVYKNPCDMVIFQEIIYKIQPDLIIETGTGKGGSSLFFATIMESIGMSKGRVISIDVSAEHSFFKRTMASSRIISRIRLINGESIDPEVVKIVKNIVDFKPSQKVLVVLDSWHEKSYVLKELEIYSKFVSLFSYLVVEDTHIHNPVSWEYAGGPKEAVDEFLLNNESFVIDQACEKLVFTFNPGGWLRRVK